MSDRMISDNDSGEYEKLIRSINEMSRKIDSLGKSSVAADLRSLLYRYINYPHLIVLFFSNLTRFLDAEFPEWKSSIDDLVDDVLLNAIQFPSHLSLSYSQPMVCGKHEDHGCEYANMSLRYLPTPNKSTFLNQYATSFSSKPTKKKLSKGDKIYRVCNTDTDADKVGNWWFRQNPKNLSKKDLRQRYAILEIWNKCDYYVESEVKSEIQVWEGKASSQNVWLRSNNPSLIEFKPCILSGGSDQILLDWSQFESDIAVGLPQLIRRIT